MNKEAQVVALAEFEGWWWGKWKTVQTRCFCPPHQKPGPQHGNCLEVCTDLTLQIYNHPYGGIVPDYLNDLNAVHEVESKLIPGRLGKNLPDDSKWHGFVIHLGNIVERESGSTGSNIHASAPQRCEAILRTLGRWG